MSSSSSYFIPTATQNDNSDSNPSFQSYTLVIPTVSHASVPQLATDLLLASHDLGLTKVGRLDTCGDVIPFVGAADQDSPASSSTQTTQGGLSAPLEVYSSPARQLAVVQQRSPVIKSRKAAFVNKLATWVRQQNFNQVLILSSLDAALRVDQELQTPVVHAFPSSKSSTPATPLMDALKAQVPPFLDSKATARSTSTVDPSSIDLPSGSGVTNRLLSALSQSSQPLPVGALLAFAAEGDNRQDAHLLARLTYSLLTGSRPTTAASEQQPTFKEPSSWEGIYGNTYDQSVYG